MQHATELFKRSARVEGEIGRITKGVREVIVATLTEYRGRKVFDIRVWFEKDGSRIPTPKGLSISIAHLREFRNIADDAFHEAVRRGDLTAEGVES